MPGNSSCARTLHGLEHERVEVTNDLRLRVADDSAIYDEDEPTLRGQTRGNYRNPVGLEKRRDGYTIPLMCIQ